MLGAGVAGIIGSAISTGGGLISSFLNKEQNDKNLEFQKEQLEYQKHLQQQIFEREDTATQRAVQDMKAAGINPILAAGNGANAGSVVETQAPQSNADYSGIATGAAGAAQALVDGVRSREEMQMKREMQEQQLKNLQAQEEKTRADTLRSILGKDLDQRQLDYLNDTYNERVREHELNNNLREIQAKLNNGEISRREANEQREKYIYEFNKKYNDGKEGQKPWNYTERQGVASEVIDALAGALGFNSRKEAITEGVNKGVEKAKDIGSKVNNWWHGYENKLMEPDTETEHHIVEFGKVKNMAQQFLESDNAKGMSDKTKMQVLKNAYRELYPEADEKGMDDMFKKWIKEYKGGK